MSRVQILYKLVESYQSELTALETEYKALKREFEQNAERMQCRISLLNTRLKNAGDEIIELSDAAITSNPALRDLLVSAPNSQELESIRQETVDQPLQSDDEARSVAASDIKDSKKVRALAIYIINRATRPITHRELMLEMNKLGASFRSNNPSDMATKALLRLEGIKSPGTKGYWATAKGPPMA